MFILFVLFNVVIIKFYSQSVPISFRSEEKIESKNNNNLRPKTNLEVKKKKIQRVCYINFKLIFQNINQNKIEKPRVVTKNYNYKNLEDQRNQVKINTQHNIREYDRSSDKKKSSSSYIVLDSEFKVGKYYFIKSISIFSILQQ